MDNIRQIGSSDIRRVLSYKELLPAIQSTLAAFSRGPSSPVGAVQPLRSRINVEDQNGQLIVMPGYLPGQKALATKILTLFPGNVEKGLSSHNAIVILMCSETGQMQALLDGQSITELRTAASSGIASKFLSPPNVTKVAVLGAGTQGASHARVHHFLFKPEKISIWSRTMSSAKRLVCTLSEEGIPAVVAASVEEATRDADIINTCTLSPTPILPMEFVKPGAHINAVGAPRPDWSELEAGLMTSSVIYADSREAALVESGDVIKSKAEIYAEIGEVINEEKEARSGQTTIYKSLGIAVLDSISARLAFDLLEFKK